MFESGGGRLGQGGVGRGVCGQMVFFIHGVLLFSHLKLSHRSVFLEDGIVRRHRSIRGRRGRERTHIYGLSSEEINCNLLMVFRTKKAT